MTIPLNYRGIADDIAARIATGECPPGARIPSYSQLATLYSVSISTAMGMCPTNCPSSEYPNARL